MNEKIFQQITRKLDDHEKRIRVLEARTTLVKKGMVSGTADTKESDALILSMVNKIGDCGESEEIQNKVLDKANMEGKILLCFYISHKYFKNAWLTTGEIQKITSGLGTKITAGNVSNKITGGLRKYLESGAVRKKGQSTPYRLNRKGIKRFEEIFNRNES